MELTPIYKRVIGLDVHQAQIGACAIIEQADGSAVLERREFGGFKRDRKALADWTRSIGPDLVVMESTGIYWKSPYAALEGVGIVAWVVNSRHVKAVPGRKTRRERLWQRPATGQLGRHVSGQQRISWKAKEWTYQKGQRLGTSLAVRVCAGSQQESMCAQRQVSSSQCAQGS